MELILATSDGREERRVWDDIDIDIGNANDFELSADYGGWKGDITFGKRLYIPGTEYGGIVGEILSTTNTGKIYARGYTWRGLMAHKIIEPPAGEDYRTASGELNAVIAQIVGDSFGDVFRVSTADTEVDVKNYKFNRYATMVNGLTSMLSTVGYRLDLKYIQTATGGYVEVSAQPAQNYGDEVEMSQDSRLDFSANDNRRGVNHLICLGSGELRNRTVIHLYVGYIAGKMRIIQVPYYKGIDEITEVYDNPAAESEELMEYGKERLRELMNKKEFSANVKNIENTELQIGDTITGRDYITGTVVTKPITRKIIKGKSGLMSIEYKIEGEN